MSNDHNPSSWCCTRFTTLKSPQGSFKSVKRLKKSEQNFFFTKSRFLKILVQNGELWSWLEVTLKLWALWIDYDPH